MPKIAETNFEAQGLKDIGKENTVQRLRELKNSIKGTQAKEKFEEKVESGLGLLSRALDNAKFKLRDTGSDDANIGEKFKELTDPWTAWSLDGKKPKSYMIGKWNGKNVNYQDKIYETGMLGNSSEARMFRQIWRQEMFAYILNSGWADTAGGVEKLLATQKVPKQSFEGYIKPAETLGIKLDSATTTAMKNSTYGFTLNGIQKQFSVKSLRINIGGGMIDIPQNKAGELKFHHLALSSDGQTLYGLMKNGCEGNLVEIKTVPAQQNKDNETGAKATVSPKSVADDKKPPVESPVSASLKTAPAEKPVEKKKAVKAEIKEKPGELAKEIVTYDTLVRSGEEAEEKEDLPGALAAYLKAQGTVEGEENWDFMESKINDVKAKMSKKDSKETKGPGPTEKPVEKFDINAPYNTSEDVENALNASGLRNFRVIKLGDRIDIAGTGSLLGSDVFLKDVNLIDPRLKDEYGIHVVTIESRKIKKIGATGNTTPIPLDTFDISMEMYAGDGSKGEFKALSKFVFDGKKINDMNKNQFEYSKGAIQKKPAVIEKEKKEINQIKNAKIKLNQMPVKENSEDNNFALIIQDGFEIQGSVNWYINKDRQETVSKNMNNMRLDRSIENTIKAEFELKVSGSEVTAKRDIKITIPRVEKKEATDKETTAEDVEELLDEM